MSDQLSAPTVLTAPAPLASPVIARRPWVLPVVAAIAGWVSWSVLERSGGSGHVHHLLVTGAMTVAMMSPLAIPVCVAASRSSLWSTSTRCIAAAFATFVTAWIALGAVLHVATELAVAVAPASVVAAGLAAWCGVDAVSRRRDRRLAACVVSRPLWPSAALTAAIDLGTTAAARCVATCWAAMALAAARPSLAVPVSVAIVAERLVTPRPRWWLAAAFTLMAASVAVAGWI